MAFIEENFSPVGATHGKDLDTSEAGVAMYSYITNDDLTTVKASEYFQDLANKVFRGDIVYVGSTQLDDDSSDNEYTIIHFGPTPPQQANVTITAKDINAT
jgi:hypothetical protein